MSYHATIDEDLQRAREILEKGKPDPADLTALPCLCEISNSGTMRTCPRCHPNGGTIYGADTYAAYKLLESFVTEIDELTAVVRFLKADNEGWATRLTSEVGTLRQRIFEQQDLAAHLTIEIGTLRHRIFDQQERAEKAEHRAAEYHERARLAESNARYLLDTRVTAAEMDRLRQRITQLEDAMNPHDVPPRPEDTETESR